MGKETYRLIFQIIFFFLNFRSGNVKIYLSYSSRFSPLTYLGARSGSSHREDLWKIATPESFRISRTNFDNVQFPLELENKCVQGPLLLTLQYFIFKAY